MRNFDVDRSCAAVTKSKATWLSRRDQVGFERTGAFSTHVVGIEVEVPWTSSLLVPIIENAKRFNWLLVATLNLIIMSLVNRVL